MLSLGSLFGDDVDLLRERNFQLLLLANVMAPMGSGVLSPILDSLTGPFGVSPARIGLLISAFTAPAIIIMPVAGLLADRYGRKPLLLAGLLLFGLGGTAIVLTTDFTVALGLRFLQGMGFAGMTPIIITSIGDMYAGAREAAAQGFRFTVSGLTQAIFPIASGVIVLLAWQYPFLLYALAFPVAMVVFLWFEEPTNDGTAATDTTDAVGGDTQSLRDLLSYRRVRMIVLARGLAVVVWIAFITYNSILVVQFLGGTPTDAGLLVAIGSITFASVATQAGRITDVFDSRLVPLIVGNLCLGGGFTTLLFAPGLVVAGVGSCVMGAGVGVTLSLYRSIITGYAPAEVRAGLVSLSEAFGRVTATLTPVLMGAIISTASTMVGFQSAVRLAGLTAALAVSGVSIASLLAMRGATPVRESTGETAR
jgi:MFS family permease